MPLLRVYPQGFANKIRELYPGLVDGAEGAPEVHANECPFREFDNLPFTTWPEAKLVQVLRYLRGNRHLKVPKKWLEVFLQPYEVLHQLELKRRANHET